MARPVRFLNHVIEDFAMQVTFDPVAGTGTVVHNLSLIKNEDLEFAVRILKDASRSGVSVSGLVKFHPAGEEVGTSVIPERYTGISTICSSTFDCLLIRRGIPINPIGGGVVEIDDRTPVRFTHMILYEHTTIDPLHVLMSQKTTSVTNVMRQGNGTILANMREFHMEAETHVGQVLDDLSSTHFSGILDVGMPNVPLLGVPVSPQYIGIAAVGGTNAMAAIRESGRWVQVQAMKGLIDITSMADIRTF